MEILYRRFVDRINAGKEETPRNERFQKGCRELARLLFRLLRDNDPWCISANYEGLYPLSLDNSTNCFGQISAGIEDDLYGEQAPSIDFYRFRIMAWDKEKREGQVQKIELSKTEDPKARWRLITLVTGPGELSETEECVTDPKIVETIMGNVQRWRVYPTER